MTIHFSKCERCGVPNLLASCTLCYNCWNVFTKSIDFKTWALVRINAGDDLAQKVISDWAIDNRIYLGLASDWTREWI